MTTPGPYTFTPRYWFFPPDQAICYNPATMHETPDNTSNWHEWGIYIPILGEYATDHEMLNEALNVIEQGKAQPAPGNGSCFPGGLFYRFWTTDAEIQEGYTPLVRRAKHAIQCDYYTWKTNCDIAHLEHLYEVDRRERGPGTLKPGEHPRPIAPKVMPQYRPSLHVVASRPQGPWYLHA
ncbi:hypothetical protein P170DRAFT_426901 [Aspergillus steynii IBT 23096]|uniref:Uncharacterized protein n=1 Tax=Aspergillus steynii IBT 23096 TaxID=1392250 RepID=A0A2I2G454_9EURO|nr:uncharacterized protein P170DRAFT_426901 [Aspergillus steynii IBT 23096]PLB47666.1 hypothetical protein P170DRAFT_426901 [Aspergillus steynii IBT 23096]